MAFDWGSTDPAGRPPIPAQVESELQRLSELVESRTDAYPAKAQADAKADVDYRLAYARAVLKSTGTVQEREAQALIECRKEFTAAKVNEAAASSAPEVASVLEQPHG